MQTFSNLLQQGWILTCFLPITPLLDSQKFDGVGYFMTLNIDGQILLIVKCSGLAYNSYCSSRQVKGKVFNQLLTKVEFDTRLFYIGEPYMNRDSCLANQEIIGPVSISFLGSLSHQVISSTQQRRYSQGASPLRPGNQLSITQLPWMPDGPARKHDRVKWGYLTDFSLSQYITQGHFMMKSHT